ncbi:hypothetical protein B566_EDAN015074 [Ephemera danica]|nr:hypothetical protein B566_EDAN015074 [Ephemera danica]
MCTPTFVFLVAISFISLAYFDRGLEGFLNRSCSRECYSCGKLLSPTERWITTESEDFAICTICQYSIDPLSIVLNCGHEFHRDCASQMLQYEERRCPNCRERLISSDLRGILLGGSTLQ